MKNKDQVKKVVHIQKDVACWDCYCNNCYKCFPNKDPSQNNKKRD